MSLWNDSPRKASFLGNAGGQPPRRNKSIFNIDYDGWDNKTFLMYVRDRLIYIYNESPSSDFIWRLNQIIHEDRDLHKGI
jgi:hypothetical protein